MHLIRIGLPLGIRAIINYHRHAILVKKKPRDLGLLCLADRVCQIDGDERYGILYYI